MNFKELCNKRFSVRSYLPKAIPAETLEYVLECGRLAPSAVNKQPWIIFVCQSDEIRQKLQSAYNRSWFQEAPAYLVLCRKEGTSWVRQYDEKDHGDIDVAILAEHICLAAAEQGLGSCWVCNFDPEGVRAALQIDATVIPEVIIPIGYTEDEAEKHPKNRKALKEICILK